MGMAVHRDDLHPALAAGPALAATALRKRCDAHEVLAGVDLELMRGEVVALVGPTGAGKSTLLRCLAGLEAFQDGQLLLHGRPAFRPAALRRRVGLIVQGLNLQPGLSVGQNVMLAPALAGTCGAAEAARELLARVGLAERFHAMAAALSPGQQQRVVIARALAAQPSVLLCDEITVASDRELEGEVAVAAAALASEGLALLMATRDLGFARRVADRVLFMHQGRVHEAGPPAAFSGAPATPEHRRLRQRHGPVQRAAPF
jgi:polar amino acid transport system ATP-binding protein